jgi:hypothetical protein
MELLLMKSSESPISFEHERQMIKTGLLLAESFNVVTPTLTGLGVYSNKAKATNRNIIHNYQFYFTQFGNGYTADQLEEFLAILNQLKNKKFKTRDDLINLGKLEKSMKEIEAEVNRASLHWLEENKIETLVDFYRADNLSVFDENLETKIDEFYYRNFILDEILDPDKFHFLWCDESISVEDNNAKEDEIRKDALKIFSSILFETPCLDSLSYMQLKIIRNDFLENLKPFYESIEDMNKKFDSYNLTDENIESIAKEFDIILQSHFISLEEFIDKNIYFQQIRNS